MVWKTHNIWTFYHVECFYFLIFLEGLNEHGENATAESASAKSATAEKTGLDNQRVFEEQAYWVVKFTLEDGGEKKWLGRIKEVNNGGKILMTFLRGKRTQKYMGYVYCEPPVPDEMLVSKEQMLYKVPEPETHQRWKKFVVHFDNLYDSLYLYCLS